MFFDRQIGFGLATVIPGSCSRLSYCKVLLRSLLVLAVLLLAYVLVGVAPASAGGGVVLDMAVVRGTDSHVYAASYLSPGVWSSWQSLGGSTPSPPGICEDAGYYVVWVVVRGTDNGIYVKAWSSSIGWSASWVSAPGGGAAIDAPACALLNGFLYVVVRGANNELYWNKFTGSSWSGWVDLHGASASAPVLVSIPSLSRLDLVVQGTDNGIYHKAYTVGAWSLYWDSPGGKTLSKPAATLDHYHCPGLPMCSVVMDYDFVDVAVRGTNNGVYWNSLSVGDGWSNWIGLSGATLSAPTLASYDNGCTSASTVSCSSIDALAVRGTDNAVYHKTDNAGWSPGWDSPGGSIANSPALAYVPGSSAQFLLLVEGSSNNKLYSNTVTGSTWGAYSSVGGATNSDPALVALM